MIIWLGSTEPMKCYGKKGITGLSMKEISYEYTCQTGKAIWSNGVHIYGLITDGEITRGLMSKLTECCNNKNSTCKAHFPVSMWTLWAAHKALQLCSKNCEPGCLWFYYSLQFTKCNARGSWQDKWAQQPAATSCAPICLLPAARALSSSFLWPHVMVETTHLTGCPPPHAAWLLASTKVHSDVFRTSDQICLTSLDFYSACSQRALQITTKQK